MTTKRFLTFSDSHSRGSAGEGLKCAGCEHRREPLRCYISKVRVCQGCRYLESVGLLLRVGGQLLRMEQARAVLGQSYPHLSARVPSGPLATRLTGLRPWRARRCWVPSIPDVQKDGSLLLIQTGPRRLLSHRFRDLRRCASRTSRNSCGSGGLGSATGSTGRPSGCGMLVRRMAENDPHSP
jgi:hypothetical protein